MTWFRWWHKHVRLHMKPKSEESAAKLSQKLSLVYAFFAWNALGLVVYHFYNDTRRVNPLTPEEKLTLSEGQQLAREMGKEKAKILRVSGFKVTTVDPKSTKETANSEVLTE